MRDKTDWTKPLDMDDDLCVECGDTSACFEGIKQNIEHEGFVLTLTCSSYTISNEHTKD
ncbi:hypothetical protein LCGC14_0383320 [marine sediment metagenome]|uniref:Uncharacterized protein n=1 Tax=marine sediment metagenome TaxID=412755 RepID=A0A0F9WAK6_9ZZZZ